MNKTEKASKRLKQLVSTGCLINVGEYNLDFHPARALLSPEALRWVNVYPENQSDVHEVLYDRAEVLYDRDLALYRGDALAAYVAPLGEWSGDTVEQAKDERARWAADMRNPEFKDRMDRFIQQELMGDE